MSRAARVVAAALVGLSSAACGGGAPLLHPAKTLPTGDIRAVSGVSANVALGSLGEDLQRARDAVARDPSLPGAAGLPSSPGYAKGALVAAAIAPGLAPFVGARIGVGAQYEGGLAYTGRAVRADMRRSFDVDQWSFSVGLGASAALYGRQQGSDLPNVDLAALHGFGADLPLLAGWESTGGLYKVWFGPRVGYERNIVEMLTTEPKDVPLGVPPLRLESSRYWGGGVVGAATGFNHVHVAVEVDVAYQIVNGSYNDTSATVRGVTLAPASAIWVTF